MFLYLLPLILALISFPGMVLASDDVAEQSHVVVPDGIFGSMRKVDSETLILPNASAVIRLQQQRTAAQEARERAAQRAEAAPVTAASVSPTTSPATPAVSDPETTLVVESVQAGTTIEEPAAAAAEPAPADPEPEPTVEPEPTPAEEAAEP